MALFAARVLATRVGSSRTDDARRIIATELPNAAPEVIKVELVKAQATPLEPASGEPPDCGDRASLARGH